MKYIFIILCLILSSCSFHTTKYWMESYDGKLKGDTIYMDADWRICKHIAHFKSGETEFNFNRYVKLPEHSIIVYGTDTKYIYK